MFRLLSPKVWWAYVSQTPRSRLINSGLDISCVGSHGHCLTWLWPDLSGAGQASPLAPPQGSSSGGLSGCSPVHQHTESTYTLKAHGASSGSRLRTCTFPWGPVIKMQLPRCAGGLQATIYKTLQGTMPNQTTCVQRYLIQNTT